MLSSLIVNKKYVSEFVKKQRTLQARIKANETLVWNSAGKNTYVKKRDGKLW